MKEYKWFLGIPASYTLDEILPKYKRDQLG